MSVSTTDPTPTLSFETFWQWVMQHSNCILRAGTRDALLFDDDDLHWHFAADDGAVFVQVIRGKRLLGELAIDTARVAYVQALGEEPAGEWAFELVSEGGTELTSEYFFVLSHSFDESAIPGHERAVH
jgi:hypothetical protein